MTDETTDVGEPLEEPDAGAEESVVDGDAPSTDPDPAFESLLEYLKSARGFDFTGYKRTSLGRRIRKRMSEVGISRYADYVDHLQAHPEEVGPLFDTILINVTAFRRDPDHWDHVRNRIIPELIERIDPDDQIRVWSAGCSTGEEPYTLAMLFCDALGIETFKERVKIYATDVDMDALDTARQGSYEDRHLSDLSEEQIEKYFERRGVRRDFRRDIRRSVIFGRHDLVQDAPISKIDLLVCRNLLMYFTPETQSRILSRLHFALNDRGYLFLGRAEMLLTRSNLFSPVDLAHRIFAKSPDTIGRRRPVTAAATLTIPHVHGRAIRLRDQAFLSSSTAQVVVDTNGSLVLANHAARVMFDLQVDAIGKSFSDLEVSYRPIELRGHMQEAYRERRAVRLSNVARAHPEGQIQHLDIEVTPLMDPDGATLGVLVTFADVSDFERLRAELQRSNHDLESAYENLQATNEELLTTNEELQSTVEELETTNEELQSANEELETMNEELQSSNLEQEEVNTELSHRQAELDAVNAFLGAILSTLKSGVIVIDDQLVVRVWDATSRETWGLREDEVVGRELTSLDCGLPIDQLLADVQSCAAAGIATEREVDAVNRVGRPIHCAIRMLPLNSASGSRGAVLLIDATDKADKSDV